MMESPLFFGFDLYMKHLFFYFGGTLGEDEQKKENEDRKSFDNALFDTIERAKSFTQSRLSSPVKGGEENNDEHTDQRVLKGRTTERELVMLP